jgi:hypothetical protein
MKKTHKESKIEEVEVIDDIFCNYCGKSCKNEYGQYEGLIEHHICGGYGSKLGDSIEYTFSICEICLDNLFDRFVHKPKISDCELGD